MSNGKKQTPRQITTARWIRITFTGWLLGFIAVVVFSSVIESLGIENAGAHLGFGMGFGVGLMQWLLLRKHLNINTLWIWFAVIGLGVPYLAFDIAELYTGATLSLYRITLGTAVGGISIGLLQSRLLRNLTGVSGNWIFRSFLGWTLAAMSVIAIDFTKYISGNNWVLLLLNVMLILIGGVILGFSTGTVGKIITGRSNPEIPNPV